MIGASCREHVNQSQVPGKDGNPSPTRSHSHSGCLRVARRHPCRIRTPSCYVDLGGAYVQISQICAPCPPGKTTCGRTYRPARSASFDDLGVQLYMACIADIPSAGMEQKQLSQLPDPGPNKPVS